MINDKKRILVVILTVFSLTNIFAQRVEMFFPWDNRLNQLIVDDLESIPILNGGYNYRIIKVSGVKSRKVDLKYTSSNTKVSFYYLPIMKNYNNGNILDVVLPLGMQKSKEETKYFLVKLLGTKPGTATITLNVDNWALKKNIFVSKKKSITDLGVNVWGYFDYNRALKGKKVQMEKLFKEASVKTIVIPPMVLPSINSNNYDFKKVEEYLPEDMSNFDKYILFLGLNREGVAINDRFRNNYSRWIKYIRDEFRKVGVAKENLYIYTVDEPTATGTKFVEEVIKLDKHMGLNSQFYSTFGSATKTSVPIKNNNYFLAQVSSKRFQSRPTFQGKNYDYWIYDVVSSSRNVRPSYFLGRAFEAYQAHAKGIGIWNFCDISKAYTAADMEKALVMGSWETKPSNPTYDYSLIYFSDTDLYPSLRFIALGFAQEEYAFLTGFKSDKFFNGDTSYCQKVIRNYREWEKYKLSVLKDSK